MEEHSALVPANYEKLPKEAKKTADSTFDRIYKYYHNDKSRVELSQEEHDIRERWEKAWLLLCRHRTGKQVAEVMTKIFGISQALAYDDVRNAMKLFSNPKDDLKEAKRAILEHRLEAGADKAWKAGNLELHLKYLKELSELTGLKDIGTNNELADIIKKLKPTTIILKASTEDLQDQVRKMMDQIAEDIPHDEVNE